MVSGFIGLLSITRPILVDRFPQHCPVCQSSIVYERDGVIARCSGGLYCDAQRKENIKHFASRKAMDIEGLGDKLVEQLINDKLVSNVADLYALSVDQIEGMERMAKKSASNLVDSLSKSKHCTLARFLYAMGIPLVGETTAEILAAHSPDLDHLMSTDEEALQTIPDIGPVVAASIVTFFQQTHNREVIDKLIAAGVQWPDSMAARVTENSRFSGKIVVITGTLSMSRAEAKQILQSMGARVTASVSKNTDYVIVGADAGAKADQAEQLQITMLDEKQFLELNP